MTARLVRVVPIVGACLAVIGVCLVARGQMAEPPTGDKEDQPAPAEPVEPTDSGEFGVERKKKRKAFVRFSELADRRIYQLAKLEKAIHKKLQLDRAQAAAIKRVLDDYVAELRATVSELEKGARSSPVPLRPNSKEFAELKAKVAAARKAGDYETARRLSERILHGGKSRASRSALAMRLLSVPTTLFEKISAELPKGQRSAFNRLARRWWALYPQSVMEYPLGPLFRAVLDPELRISNVKREALRKMIAEASADLPVVGSNEALVRRRYEETFLKISESLTPAQRVHFQATLKELERDAAMERAAAKKRTVSPAVSAPDTEGT